MAKCSIHGVHTCSYLQNGPLMLVVQYKCIYKYTIYTQHASSINSTLLFGHLTVWQIAIEDAAVLVNSKTTHFLGNFHSSSDSRWIQMVYLFSPRGICRWHPTALEPGWRGTKTWGAEAYQRTHQVVDHFSEETLGNHAFYTSMLVYSRVTMVF